ncbi:MAG: hypothetical protein MMC23_005968 [Stictis urceolatum]|nr:hypothetical protein [Stictis urceolata]
MPLKRKPTPLHISIPPINLANPPTIVHIHDPGSLSLYSYKFKATQKPKSPMPPELISPPIPSPASHAFKDAYLRSNYHPAEHDTIKFTRCSLFGKANLDLTPKRSPPVPGPHASASFFFNPPHLLDLFPPSYRLAESNLLYLSELVQLNDPSAALPVFVYNELMFPHILKRVLDTPKTPAELAQQMIPAGLTGWSRRCVKGEVYPTAIKYSRTLDFRCDIGGITRPNNPCGFPTQTSNSSVIGIKDAWFSGCLVLGLTKLELLRLHTFCGLLFDKAEVEVKVAAIEKPERRPHVSQQDHSCTPFATRASTLEVLGLLEQGEDAAREFGLKEKRNKSGAGALLKSVKAVMYAWRGDFGEQGLEDSKWRWTPEGWLEGQVMTAYERGWLDPKSEMVGRVQRVKMMRAHIG